MESRASSIIVTCVVGQEMLETPFLFYDEFVVACAYMQNAKIVRHM
jgi:hypothetical protein